MIYLTGKAPTQPKGNQKVDVKVFGNDKFANDMIHYIQSTKKIQDSDNFSSAWEMYFVNGLETLLIECGIVNDDIERECFVSRVYRWFTEKISEKCNLPESLAKSMYLSIILVLF